MGREEFQGHRSSEPPIRASAAEIRCRDGLFQRGTFAPSDDNDYNDDDNYDDDDSDIHDDHVDYDGDG